MFAAIAPSYDLNNRLHSLWMDQRWRRKAVKLAELKATDRVVDVACGTGDLTLAMARDLQAKAQKLSRPDELPARLTLGIDFTYEMIPLADDKLWDESDFQHEVYGIASIKGLVHFVNADAQALPLPEASADVVSIAFGIRNVADPFAA